MRRLLIWSSVAGFTACLLQPTIATITPDYSYVDGCQQVTIQGHHLGTAASARIGSAEFLDLAPAENDPEREEWAQDVGFLYTGTVPPSPDGAPGWYDVVLVVEGEELTINDGWYYRSCPATFVVDGYSVPADADAGSSISFEGCGLSADVKLQFLDATSTVADEADLVSDCSTAFVHADVPSLPAGDYTMQLVAGDGTVFPLASCFAESGDTGVTCVSDVVTVSAR